MTMPTAEKLAQFIQYSLRLQRDFVQQHEARQQALDASLEALNSAIVDITARIERLEKGASPQSIDKK